MKLNEINDYANIKQPTDRDLRLPLRQVITQRYETETGIGNNQINLPFSVDQSNTSNFLLYINGTLINSPDDFVFTNINGYNASSTIALTLTPVAVMPVIALNLGIAVEVSPNLANIQAQINQMTIVGEVKQAFLTESQFQSQAGANWVLADGRDVTGSTFATLFGSNNIPDMRATVPRMKDNGKGLDTNGDLALGTYEADQYLDHVHQAPTYNGGSGVAPVIFGGAGSFVGTWTSGGSGGSETQGKSTVVNFFIRIN